MALGKFTSPRLTLHLTEQVWSDAVRASSGSCIVAEAIKQQYPQFTGVSVDMATIRFSDPKKGLRYTYLTPEAAQIMLLSFDQGWDQPDDHREVKLRSAVKTTKIQRHSRRAEARTARMTELTEKQKLGTLTGDEKRALNTMRKHPDRATTDGKTEVAADPHNRTIHGRAPKQGPNNPNLLRGRNRQFGKKIARPAVLFEQAVQKAVDERIKQEMSTG